MPTISGRLLALCSLALAPLLAACPVSPSGPANGGNGGQASQGLIYYRVYQDLSFPPNSQAGWCELRSSFYQDDNPAVPDDPAAHMINYVGPSQPGTFQAQYNFSSTGPIVTFSYTLERPAPGYRRLYTRMLRQYNASLNRCLDVSKEVAKLTYIDEAL